MCRWLFQRQRSGLPLSQLANGCSEDADEVCVDVIIVDPWMLWGKDEVWVVDIMVDPWVNWRANGLGGRYHG